MDNYKYQTGMDAQQMPIDTDMLSQMMSAQGAGQGVDFNGEPTPNISGKPSFADMYQEIKQRYDKLILPLERKLAQLKKKLEDNPTDATIKNEIARIEEKIDRLEQQEDMEVQQLEAEVEASGQQIEQQKQMQGIEMPVQDEGMPEYMPQEVQQMPQEGMPMMQKGGNVPKEQIGTAIKDWLNEIGARFAAPFYESPRSNEHQTTVDDLKRELNQMDEEMPFASRAVRVLPPNAIVQGAIDMMSNDKDRLWEDALLGSAPFFLSQPLTYALGTAGGIGSDMVIGSGLKAITGNDLPSHLKKLGLNDATSDFLGHMIQGAPGGFFGAKLGNFNTNRNSPKKKLPIGLDENGIRIGNTIYGPDPNTLSMGFPKIKRTSTGAGSNNGARVETIAQKVKNKYGADWSKIEDLDIYTDRSRAQNEALFNRLENGELEIVDNGNGGHVIREVKKPTQTTGNQSRSLYDSLNSRLKEVGAIKQETIKDAQGKKYVVNTITTSNGKKYYISSENNPRWATNEMNIINGKTGSTRMAGESTFSSADDAIAKLNLIESKDGGKFMTWLFPHLMASVRNRPAEGSWNGKPVASYLDPWRSPEKIPLYDAKKNNRLWNFGKAVGTEWTPWNGGYTFMQRIGHKGKAIRNNIGKGAINLATDLGYLGEDFRIPGAIAIGIKGGHNLSKTGNFITNEKEEKSLDEINIPKTDSIIIQPMDSTINIERNMKALDMLENHQKGGTLLSQFPITDFISVGYDMGKLADNSGMMNIEAKRNLPMPSNNLWYAYDKAENDYRQQQKIDSNNYQLNNIKAMRQQPLVGEYGSLHMNNMAHVLNSRIQNEALLNNEKAYNAATESTNKTLGSIAQDAFKDALERDSALAIAKRDVLDKYYKDLNTLRNEKVSSADSMMSRIMNIGNQIKQYDEIWDRYYKILHDKNLTDTQKQMMINTLFFTNGRMPEEKGN